MFQARKAQRFSGESLRARRYGGPGRCKPRRSSTQLEDRSRKKRGVREWIQREDDAGEYIRGGKEANDKALALVAKLHDSDRKVWLELDALGR